MISAIDRFKGISFGNFKAASRSAIRLGAWLVLIAALAVYWLTVEPTASFWDCPEYILVGSKLEIGHPPGNPTWMLVANVASHLAPDSSYIALAINLTSGLFTALAAMLLYLIILRLMPSAKTQDELAVRVVSALSGALVFAWCDTAWFSAVEAEVYAFSIFCTALCVWLMLRWRDVAFTDAGDRLLILTAYITGLSIGMHQLNLLCLPTLALIYVYRRYPARSPWRVVAALVVSLLMIAMVLYGMMPGALEVASLFELLFVNTFGLPFHSGVVGWCIIVLLAALSALWLTGNSRFRLGASVAAAIIVWLSGIFYFCGGVIGSAILSLLGGAALFIFFRRRSVRYASHVALWCLTLLLAGYSTYALILIRGAAQPPVNEGAPTNIFALKAYLGREQYGGKPLLYGRTPYSEMLRREKISSASGQQRADYSEIWREYGATRYAEAIAGAMPERARAGLDSATIHSDAILAARASSGKDAYVAESRKAEYKYTPELDMFFPRITSRDPEDIKAYGPWSGMTPDNMDSVRISYALDSAGNPVGRLDAATGERIKEWGKRPTYAQNFRYLFQYQIGYMYMRYLMWNFSGRQNDTHSTGEADNGNFLTGIAGLDDYMLGPQKALPPSRSADNRGHHIFYMIPLLLGFIGLGAQLARGRRGRRMAAIVGSLFLMTGVVIVIYVNQTPGEPRERDYSYVGSFMAFAIWIAVGIASLLSLCRRIRAGRFRRTALIVGFVCALGLPLWMLISNWPDHNRSGRRITTAMAQNLLGYLEPNAIIFVNGDNFTFPLWYAREVEKIRPDVRIVNIAYLGTEWYARQMMMPDRDSEPVAMTAKPSDLAYDNFSLALYGSPAGMPRSRNAVDALRDLYSQKGWSTPKLKADSLFIGSPDGPAVSVAAVAGGKRTIGLAQLLMLDIVATNAASSHPRPVYWISAMKPHNFSGLYEYTLNEGLTRRLTESKQPTDSIDTARFLSILTSDGSKESGSGINGYFRKFDFGNASGSYVDPTSISVLSPLRRSMISLALQLAEKGDYRNALSVAEAVSTNLPDSAWKFGVNTQNYIIVDEAVQLARTYALCSQGLKRADLKEKAFEILRSETIHLAQWRHFWNSIANWRKNVMSPRPRMESSQLYAPIALWLELGGDRAEILRLAHLDEASLQEEKIAWEKDMTLRKMLYSTRYPVADSLKIDLFRRFRDLGGSAGDLQPYPEFETSPYLYLLPE